MRTLILNLWNPESTIPQLGSMQSGTASKGLFLHLLPGCMRLESKLEGRAFAYRDKALFFLIGVQLLYNVVLVSAVQQSESAVSIHTLLPFEPPRPPSHTLVPHLQVLTEHRAELPELCSSVLPAICFTHGVYMPALPSPLVPLPLPLPVSTCPFSMSVSLFTPWI